MRKDVLDLGLNMILYSENTDITCYYCILISRYSDRIWAGLPGFHSQQRQVFFSSTWCPNQFWGPHSLLSNWYREPFPQGGGYSDRGVKLTCHLHPMPRSRMVELFIHPPPPMCLPHVFNYESTGTTLPYLTVTT
jgi:hypothetical protein